MPKEDLFCFPAGIFSVREENRADWLSSLISSSDWEFKSKHQGDPSSSDK